MSNSEAFMKEAIRLSEEVLHTGKGGPFGWRDRQGRRHRVGRGSNKVTIDNDPTAHAEVVAIRNACKEMNTFQLDDCELYTSCEPCPMCLSAIYWARIPTVYYGNDRVDAAKIGFDDDFIYQQVPPRSGKTRHQDEPVPARAAQVAFKGWGRENRQDQVLTARSAERGGTFLPRAPWEESPVAQFEFGDHQEGHERQGHEGRSQPTALVLGRLIHRRILAGPPPSPLEADMSPAMGSPRTFRDFPSTAQTPPLWRMIRFTGLGEGLVIETHRHDVVGVVGHGRGERSAAQAESRG